MANCIRFTLDSQTTYLSLATSLAAAEFSIQIFFCNLHHARRRWSVSGVEAQDAMAVVQQGFAGHELMRRRELVKPVALLHDQTGALENFEMFAAHVHAAADHIGKFGHGHGLAGTQRAEHPPAAGMADGGEQLFVVKQRSGGVGLFGNGNGFHTFFSENSGF
jgi:hypothetical protein